MGLFSKLPRWAKKLPPHLRPSPGQIARLEKIRKECGFDNEGFFLSILGHDETTRRAQRFFYKQIKFENPGLSDQEILKRLLLSRLITSWQNGFRLFGLSPQHGLDAEKLDKNLEIIVRKNNALESLTNAIIKEESGNEIPPSPGLEDAARRVGEILKGE